ncbi:hypothetical protein SPRG_10944 [Saprolegnia parasitica CBS 223.65]|uniref:PX domain-containing protein n=1 Tax=Saprolegnia parasitica (strain CBS 223.65) TaxID=695850 RepID=A0A067BZ57_SAPPC|nr:hypothetical protein SPRG_10944 [Saprolegnia parasitica CBS 223.65]KDO22125.1 hypothetical protein SPRG_10944 [Saprolegnia parasitica CBS 223.65]|eukprot:XP_012207164.1 hypothetical protein SPRG_10944 [Saprolegnia parasitica CBS 223.65]
MALNQLLHRKSRLTRRRASSIRTMRNVEVPRYEVLRSSKTTVYITTVDNGTDYWELPIRYSKYHDFFTTLCKTDKKWVAKLPFPEKSFGFGKDSPDFRRRQLDLFMRQLNALFTSLSAEGQDVVMDFLEAKHHVYHYEREASIYDHYDDEKASRRGYKSSVASDTDCEDNASEHNNLDGLSSPSFPDRTSSLHHVRSSSLHSSSHCSSIHEEEVKLPPIVEPVPTPVAPTPVVAPVVAPTPTVVVATPAPKPKLHTLVSQVEGYAPMGPSAAPIWQQHETTLSTYTRPAHLNPVVVKTWGVLYPTLFPQQVGGAPKPLAATTASD